MTAWRLLWLLLAHILRGRGGDRVYLHIAGDCLSEDMAEVVDQHDWALTDLTSAGDGGRFVSLGGEPEECYCGPAAVGRG